MTRDNIFNIKAVYGIPARRLNCSTYVLQQKILRRLREFKPLFFEGKSKPRAENEYEEIHEKILNMNDKELSTLWEKKDFEPFMDQIKNTPSHYSFYGTH